MKITKSQLKQIIKEELEAVLDDNEKEPQTMETLLGKLEELLQNWPVCGKEPESLACKYHKDLEKVVTEYHGTGCPAGSHEDEKVDATGPGLRIGVAAATQYIDES
jgi:hypothetical protein